MHTKQLKKRYILFALAFILLLLIYKFSEVIWNSCIDPYFSRITSVASEEDLATPKLEDYLSSIGINPHVSADNLKPVSRTGSEWFTNAPLIYHACGGIQGLDYTNSKEALDACLSGNNSFIEVDFSFTSDNRLVCLHDWINNSDFKGKIPCYDTFMSSLLYGKYTPLSAEDILSYMADFPDLHIIVDTKDNILDVMSYIVSLTSDESLLNRFIIQIYAPGEKEKISSIYPFPEGNYLLTIYKLPYIFLTAEQILGICYSENITVITAPVSYFSEDDIQLINSKNFIVYEHTVNQPDIAKVQISKGIHGFYTDFLSIDEIS